MYNQANTCPIWGHSEGISISNHGFETYVEDSLRAGVQYIVNRDAQIQLQDDPTVKDDPKVKARLTTMLVDEREQGVPWPRVTIGRIEEAKRADPLSVPKRAERLLRYLVKCSMGEIGSEIHVLDLSAPDYKGALAWSESTEWSEIVFLSDYLSKEGWVEIAEYIGDVGRVTVTVDGYARIDSLKTSSVDSAQAFVAMWFDDETDDAYEKGIKPAIEQSGYTPMRIDRKPDANKLDDDIIAEIRKSRFLVSDMTHGKDGARGSVYFEAGFADGLGIPVIYTCRSDLMDEVHFDTRQYAYIVWETPDDLRKGLMDRILARIGEGPNKP